MTNTMFPDNFTFPVLSDKLIRVYADWYQWVVNGAPDREPFSCAEGLCYSIFVALDDFDWQSLKFLRAITMEAENQTALKQLSKELEIGNTSYPFGRDAYKSRRKEKTQHLDPNRLAWVEGCLRAGAEKGK